MSDTAHYGSLLLWSPLTEAHLDSVLDQAPVHGSVVDVGCGGGELLCRLAERGATEVVGIEHSAGALSRARHALSFRAPTVASRWLQGDASQVADLRGMAWVCSVGGPRVASTLPQSWARLSSWLAPGGLLLLGEGFWRSPPPAAYLAATGIEADELPSFGATMSLARALGWHRLHTHVSTRAEWEHFEGGILKTRRAQVAARPEDAGLAARLAGYEAFYTAQQRWGRQCMGFALHLFRRLG